MRICIVSQYFPPRIKGGGEYAAYLTAKSLAKQGNNVDVLTTHPSFPGPPVSDLENSIHQTIDGFRVHRILGMKAPKLWSIDVSGFSIHELFFIQSVFSILNFVRNMKPDVIHAMNIDSIPPSIMAGKISRIPVVATINSHAVTCPKGERLDAKRRICEVGCNFSFAKICLFERLRSRPWRGLLFLESYLWWSILKVSIRHADKVIAISEYVRGTLIRDGVEPKDIKVIPEIMDSDFANTDINPEDARKEFGFFPKDKIILYAGAIFDSRKGSDVLINAMPSVLKKIPDAKFAIAGHVPDKEVRLIERSGLKKSVIFTGFLPRHRLSLIFKAADVIVFPSVIPEPFGLVLTEAMGMEKPIVASKIGGIPEIVDDERCGILVDPNRSDELAAAILRVLEDEKLAKRLSKAGRKTVESRFTEKAVTAKILQTYRSSFE